MDEVPFIYFNQDPLVDENENFIKENGIELTSELGICLRGSAKWLALLLGDGAFKYNDLNFEKTMGKQQELYDKRWDEIREQNKNKSFTDLIKTGVSAATDAIAEWGNKNFTDANGAQFKVQIQTGPTAAATHISKTPEDPSGIIKEFLDARPLQDGQGYVITLAGKFGQASEPLIHYMALGKVNGEAFFLDINSGVWGFKPNDAIGANLEDYITRIYKWKPHHTAFIPMSSQNITKIRDNLVMSPEAMTQGALKAARLNMSDSATRRKEQQRLHGVVPKLSLGELANTIKSFKKLKTHIEKCLIWPSAKNPRMVTLQHRQTLRSECDYLSEVITAAQNQIALLPDYERGARPNKVENALSDGRISEQQALDLDIECGGRRDKWNLIDRTQYAGMPSGKAIAIDNPGNTWETVKSAYFELPGGTSGGPGIRKFVKIDAVEMSEKMKRQIHTRAETTKDANKPSKNIRR